MTRHLPLLCSGLLSFALVGCALDSEPAAVTRGALISDEVHNSGTEGFLFLPPMVPRPAQLGDVVPDLPVRVEVDEIDPSGATKRHITTFTTDTAKPKDRLRFKAKDAPLGPEDDGDTDPMGFYVARWKTNDDALSTEATYRISVHVPGRRIGFADVDVVKNQRQFKNVDTTAYTPLVDGDVLRIKFRIDRPAVDADADGIFDWDEVALDATYGCAGERSNVELGVSQGGADDPDHDVRLHAGPLEVVCGDVRFPLDPALGAGAFKAETKLGDRTYTLGYTVKSAQTVTSGPRIRRTWTTLSFANDELANQGLAGCVFSGFAAASEGPGHTANGTPIDLDDEWPLVVLDRVPLTCAPQTIDGAGARIYSDLAVPPQLCTFQSGATVKRHAFADLHTSVATAVVGETVAHFGGLGQRAAGRCPNAPDVYDDAEAFTLLLPKGQPSVTLRIASFKGTEAHKAALYPAAVAAYTLTKDGNGKEVVSLLETTTLGAIWAGRTIQLPSALVQAEGAHIVLVGTFDRNKNPPPPPPPVLTGGPIDKPDLDVDVEVK